MSEEACSDVSAVRRSLRPVLIISARNLTEHTTFLRHLLVGLADESIPAALICPGGFDTESVAPAPAALFTHPLIDWPLMDHVGIERLAWQVEKFKPTLLYCLCESRAGLTRRLARRLDVPYMLMIDSLEKRIRRLSLSPHRCARIIVPADAIRAHAAQSLARFADRVALIHMGTFVDTDTMCFAHPSRLPSLIVAHPLDRLADFEIFFKAVKSLQMDGQEFMVVLMGAGPAEQALRRLLITLGLSDVVTIVPVLDPWRSVVAAGDIFVQPQPPRKFSAFLLEAMAVGTAVAGCWGGVDDLIIPNQTAAVFEPDSEPSVRQTLKQLLDDHDYARRLAMTAQEHIRARHSVSAMVAAILRTSLEAQQQFRPQTCP
jgi:glycosyltransferase involved in cell wall biosynthesis